MNLSYLYHCFPFIILMAECSVECPTKNVQERPTLDLKSPELFVMDRNITKSNGTILLPGMYHELEYECNSSFPTEWIYTGIVKDLVINKKRIVHEQGENFTFTSTIKYTFNNQDEPFNLTCRNICGCDLCNSTSLDVTFKHNNEHESQSDTDVAVYTLHLHHDTNISEETKRLKNCSTLLNVDHTGKYECNNKSTGKEMSSQIIPCRNPDECRLLYQNQDCLGSQFTYSNSCSSDWCYAPLDRFSSFIIVCNGRSLQYGISRNFFRPMQMEKSNKSIYEYLHEKNSTQYTVWKEQIGSLKLEKSQVEDPWNTCEDERKNRSLICQGESRLFRCSGLKALFTSGFYWSVVHYNKSHNITEELGHGEEWSEYEDSSVFHSNKSIEFGEMDNALVICSASLWNSFDWINYSLPVNLTRPQKPHIKSLQNIGSGEIFRCIAPEAVPPASFSWMIHKGDMANNDTVTAKMANVIEIHDNFTDLVNLTLADKDKDVFITCIARNFAGTDSKTIRILATGSPKIPSHIIVPIVTGVISLILLVVLFFSCRKIRTQKQILLGLSDDEVKEFQNGNPNGTDAFILPYNMELEIPRENIIMGDKILGQGAFGMVVSGKIGIMTVAIKTVKKTADVDHLKALMSELKIFSFVGRHPNIVNLIGSCTQNIHKREILVVLEYCEQGNMLKLLRQCRGSFVNYLDKKSKEHERRSMVEYQNAAVKKLSTKDLIRWSHEIALGMEFLSSKNVIHGDLAARNILITEDLNAKVSDFGLSKRIFDYKIYVQHADTPLPLRWMSYEALKDLEFSIESDVWSYGIVLYEIFSLGEIPYPGIEWGFDSHMLILQGKRNPKPTYAPDYIYTLMSACWNIEPKARPTFTNLKDSIQNKPSNVDKGLLQLPT